MLSSDKAFAQFRRLALFSCIAILASCTVKPLYSEGPSGAPAKALASIEIEEVDDRVSQQVRNALIFAVAGGAGEPADAQYHLALTVTRRVSGVLYDQTTSNNDPTTTTDTARAGRIVVKADYNLTRKADGVTIRSGTRSAVALADFPAQEFAKLRAIRDGENRAAREVAETIRADLAAALAR